MNKQVSPVMTVVIIACAVVVLGVVIWRAMIGKQSYPGQNAGQPTAEKGRIVPTSTTTPEQARGHISGAPPMATQGH
jgi:hypothetical protein